MNEFGFERLRRAPDVEASNLFAYDATDRLLVERALALSAEQRLSGSDIAVIGDEYGAITLALTDAGYRGIRLHQDLVTGRRALARNADELGISGFESHELDSSLLEGARLVLLQLPKSLAELEEIADAVARWAAPDVVLVAGGRVKHMTLAQNELLGRSFAEVQPQRAERKSRLIVASGALAVPAQPPHPQRAEHPEFGLTLVAHGGAFAANRIDIGTRVLLEVLAGEAGSAAQLRRSARLAPESRRDHAELQNSSGVMPDEPQVVVDLGCGTGALAAHYALHHPEAHVMATDRSAAATASARETMMANGVADRVTVTHDDAGSDLPAAGADLILLNPPFHLGASVHTGAATRLFAASARLLRPGGELLTVFNSSLAYRPELTRLIGRTEQVHRTSKFTVTCSIRR
ncbi:class I SAM-dependent methyltransferase [Microbacterium sp. AK031]|uniref:class I SAM-dependent methyltransferase n=1 Tax=Microbacterium sp. AK031 TaxID=2723076 RepID=UPI002169891D|nr:class I SAM-dependent methyltransferase [Microbacterium sp. AK031]MCS3844522.1 16S rRNA (guanine1207-N2)-methyltransferase [Microbacterium sp. AK031]